jgi:putative FmdB family regulatory protein
MPIYEYKCHNCGKTFEVIQKFSDSALTRHEECGGEVERLISTSALQFKGTGWYVTDYARGSKTNGSTGKSDSKPAEKSESTSESKSESKTEVKSESKSESKPQSKPAATE